MADVARSQYEDQQARLQAERDGEDIHIEAPKEPEVDPKVYQDVEAILFRGFLYVPADIHGIPFVLKSLNHHEYGMLRLRSGVITDDKAFHDMFLAYGVLMVSGDSVIHNRDRWLPDLAKTFASMPPKGKARVVRLLSELNRRVAGAVTLTEAYAMESYSRFRWVQLSGIDMCSTSITGIPGTEALGLNWAQLVWRALNTFEDQREQAERDWDNAKFIGSCFAGKGMSKVYAQDTERKRKETERRIARKDALLRHVFLGKPLDGADQRPGEVMVVAKTVDELAGQLERSLKGERDWHDEVVATIEDRARQRERDKQDRLHKLMQEREIEWGPNRRIVGETSLEGLSPEDVRKRVAARRQQIDASVSQQRDPRIEESLDKWLGADEPPMAPVRVKPR
jgi:hypothetical protein